MEALEAIAKRTSVRKYEPDQIPEDALQSILQAGMAAPVGSNAYDTLHLTVVQDMGLLNEIGDAVTDLVEKVMGRRMDKNFGAPTMVVVSASPGHMPGIEMANAGTVLENMAIAATSLGIDNIIWGGAAAVIAHSDDLMARLHVPEGFKPALVASFGYGVAEERPKRHEISVNRV